MPVEIFTKASTVVGSVQEAFVFVMARLEAFGEAPSIEINPVWWYDEEDGPNLKFEVCLSGSEEETRGV